MENQNILDVINNLITQKSANVDMPTIAPLDYQAPSGADIDAKWKEFLDRASKDPDIINYYQNILTQAKGDTKLAVSFLEKDYQVGTRQVKDNLTASLENLGLVEPQEQEDLAARLNQRGVALTQTPSGGVEYAGGGIAGTELGRLNESQRLRKEAEKRTAMQNVETLGLTREKGITSAGQNLSEKSQNLEKQKQQDILNRANTYYGMYTNKKGAELQQKIYDQQYGTSSGGSGGYVDPTMGGFGSYERPDLSNPFKEQKYNEYKKSIGA